MNIVETLLLWGLSNCGALRSLIALYVILNALKPVFSERYESSRSGADDSEPVLHKNIEGPRDACFNRLPVGVGRELSTEGIFHLLSAVDCKSLFVAIDFENIQGILHDAKSGTNSNTQVGLAILDVKRMHTWPPMALIHTVNFATGSKRYQAEANQKFLFGRSTPITHHEMLHTIQSLIPTDRETFLVGHAIQNELRVLSALGFKTTPNVVLVDTLRLISATADRDFHSGSLAYLLQRLGCPHSHLHCGGNDANFTLRAFMLLILKGRKHLCGERLLMLRDMALSPLADITEPLESTPREKPGVTKKLGSTPKEKSSKRQRQAALRDPLVNENNLSVQERTVEQQGQAVEEQKKEIAAQKRREKSEKRKKRAAEKGEQKLREILKRRAQYCNGETQDQTIAESQSVDMQDDIHTKSHDVEAQDESRPRHSLRLQAAYKKARDLELGLESHEQLPFSTPDRTSPEYSHRADHEDVIVATPREGHWDVPVGLEMFWI